MSGYDYERPFISQKVMREPTAVDVRPAEMVSQRRSRSQQINARFLYERQCERVLATTSLLKVSDQFTPEMDLCISMTSPDAIETGQVASIRISTWARTRACIRNRTASTSRPITGRDESQARTSDSSQPTLMGLTWR
jgi:hypothetical protein